MKTNKVKLFHLLFNENLITNSRFNIGPVYHGGSWDGIKTIKANGKGALGVGAYFTPNKDVADNYARESGGKVIETYLDIKKPLEIFTDNSHRHPVVDAMVTLGVDEARASKLVEKIEEKSGYIGSQLKNLATAQGYDAIYQYFNGKLREIVIWNKDQVKHLT